MTKNIWWVYSQGDAVFEKLVKTGSLILLKIPLKVKIKRLQRGGGGGGGSVSELFSQQTQKISHCSLLPWKITVEDLGTRLGV